jgi:hypothetical protein
MEPEASGHDSLVLAKSAKNLRRSKDSGKKPVLKGHGFNRAEKTIEIDVGFSR